jgi:ATP-dependent RNA helicase RhlE
MPIEIRKLAQQWLRNPAAIEVGPASTPVDRVAQSVHLVDKKRKQDLLARFLKETPRGRTLVFSRTKHGADKIVQRLKKEGLYAAAIHGNKSQGARTKALQQFKSKNPPVLVATDIAARGLDINDVSHVVNFDLPDTPEVYVHRIGRTARAGAEGIAVSFCAGDERGLLKQIERLTNCTVTIEPTIHGFEPIDPISYSSKIKYGRSNGNGNGSNGGGAKRKPGNKPRRFQAKTKSAPKTDQQSDRPNGSTTAGNYRKKTKRVGQTTASGAARNRRRRRGLSA